MLRKGLSKGKLLMDLNMMLKRRSKLARKAIANLVFHHHHNHGGSTSNCHPQFSASREYESSCSNTPNYVFPIGKRHRHNHNNFFNCVQVPPARDDEAVTVNAVKAVLEMLNNEVMVEATASPVLPGFGRSPMVRHLRVTDSPFPLVREDDEKDNQVDKAAEDFINRFYSQLRNQD